MPGDDLCAHQPFCRQVLRHGFHFLFTCKPASHPHLSQWVEALGPGRDRHTRTLRTKGKSSRWEQHAHRRAHVVPLTTYLPFENWSRLLDFMMRGLEIGPPAAAKS